ncbi:hypothetical protein [Natrinema salinisoli]|uniref:hypothetical protein n=1 Tax=Natrinema salinisoli TaxID=2878535 RepID=UPI001CF0224C|nr:hypothetical protein [Natrinema salinisoli]
MTTTRSVALLVTLTVVGLTIAPLASGAVVGSLVAEPTQSDQSETTTTNASVGTLMQANAADTENTVESEMFDAAYETADNDSRAAVVSDRTAELDDRLSELEAERETLRDERENLSRGEYRSRMAKLTVEIASLERSIDRTAHRASEAGVNETELEELRGDAQSIRQNASADAGPGTAAVARGLSKSNKSPGVGAGPPDDRGPSAGEGASKKDDTRGNNGATGNGPDSEGTGNGPEKGSTGTSSGSSNGGPPDK